VWLPTQVAKLSDREGSFAQSYLQALAIKIYRDVPVAKGLKQVVDETWEKLPTPGGVPSNGLPSSDALAYFTETDGFIARRRAAIIEVREALELVAKGSKPKGKVISERYTEGLPHLKACDIRDLRDLLKLLSANGPSGLVKGAELSVSKTTAE
jgi:hypothetical protein